MIIKNNNLSQNIIKNKNVSKFTSENTTKYQKTQNNDNFITNKFQYNDNIDEKLKNTSIDFRFINNEDPSYSHVSTTSNSNREEMISSFTRKFDFLQNEIKKLEAININLENEKNFWKNNFMSLKLKNEELNNKIIENENVNNKKKRGNYNVVNNINNPKLRKSNNNFSKNNEEEMKLKINALEFEISEWQKKYQELEKCHANETAQLKLLMNNSQVSSRNDSEEMQKNLNNKDSDCESIVDEFIGFIYNFYYLIIKIKE